ncbi:putative proton-dependent oligopeptide transporter family, MFS transporter superfamily [Helianthus debilis subsp. tardiflorus]
MIPKETIDILKDQMFGFNTFFITSQEPYEAVVLFKGNLRGSASLCTVTQVDELKIVIRMFPIWPVGIVFSAVYAQMSTMFVEQGMMMDTTIGSFTIPAASLLTFDVISVIFWVPVYDRILVPIARKFTNQGRGFTEFQGYAISQHRWVIIPPFYLLEFFYDQSPDAMHSLCRTLSLLMNSLGNNLSSFILTVVTSITTSGGQPGWIPNNLIRARLRNRQFTSCLLNLRFICSPRNTSHQLY